VTGKRTGRPAPPRWAEAAKLLGAEGHDVVVDLARYAELVEGTSA
jgi:hypothetical protein